MFQVKGSTTDDPDPYDIIIVGYQALRLICQSLHHPCCLPGCGNFLPLQDLALHAAQTDCAFRSPYINSQQTFHFPISHLCEEISQISMPIGESKSPNDPNIPYSFIFP